jgi:Arc/MetJ family transcription regulator
MRTNIDLDDQLVEEAQGISGIKTKKAVVEEALRVYIKVERHNQAESLRRRMKAAANLLEADYLKGDGLIGFTLSLEGDDFHE